MVDPLFLQVSIVIALAATLGMIAQAFRQPSLVGYLIAGLIIGPLGYLHFNEAEVLNVFAEIGITLLLFLVGLEMSVSELKHIGKPALWTGIGQVVITCGLGVLIILGLGFSLQSAFFIGLALTFSSTIVVVKLLIEKNDLQSLYGKIVVGFLLVQDVIAIIALVLIAGIFGGDPLSGGVEKVLSIAIKGGAIIAFVFFMGRRIFPLILDKIGHSAEMLFVFSMAWGLGFASLMASSFIGFSLEMGGLLAGLALANSAEHFQISSRIRPVRDFFVLMFFVVLGSKMVLSDIGIVFTPAVILSIFVLIGNPLIVMAILSLLGYRRRTSFLASLTVAQVSEFSLVMMLLGERLGLVSSTDVSTVTFVAVVTIVGSSYMITHGNEIYAKAKDFLKVFDRLRRSDAEALGPAEPLHNHIVLVGAHRTGSNIVRALEESGQLFVVVDFNPTVVKKLKSRGVPVIYGDIVDPEIQELASLKSARLVICTIPDVFDSAVMLEYVKQNNPTAKVIVNAESDWGGLKLYEEGADYVLLPHFLSGQQLAVLIREDHDFALLHKMKLRDMKLIKEDLL
jgi:Kef-type K+ transport system membrane component KefB